MAIRPVYLVNERNPFYMKWDANFVYNKGLAPSQKKKNIQAIHETFSDSFPEKKVLEISSKSMQEGGKELSAFFLPKMVPSIQRSVSVENVYQAGKVFTGGGHGKRTFFTLNYPLVHLPDFLWICVYSLFKIVQQTNLVS